MYKDLRTIGVSYCLNKSIQKKEEEEKQQQEQVLSRVLKDLIQKRRKKNIQLKLK